MNAALHTVHVRVNDAATGLPTPVRIRFTGPDGRYYAPFGRLPEFATGKNQDVGGNLLLGNKAFAYIDGSCEINLPPGRITVEIHKGFAYRTILQESDVAAGKMSLRFNLERWSDIRSERWYAGDARAHSLTPHAALLEAAAEDLAVVNLLAREDRLLDSYDKERKAISNILAFSGQSPALEMPGHMVVVNTLNSHPLLGSLALLNCHRIVYPLSFGGPDGLEDWSLADWCKQCHRKGGLVVWTNPLHETADFIYGEPLADLILGSIDAFEIEYFENSVFDVLSDWYLLLNCGLHVPLVGSSGKDCNGVALGQMRTYARLDAGETLQYRTWIEAVRAGRTFATNGPLLSFQVNEADPGSELEMPTGRPLHLQAQAHSLTPFEKLEIVANGTVIAATDAVGSPTKATLDTDWTPTAGCWLAARCWGTRRLPGRPAAQCVFAHASPVYVKVGGLPVQPSHSSIATLVKQLEYMLEWTQKKARFATERQRENLVDIFRSAREELRKSVNA